MDEIALPLIGGLVLFGIIGLLVKMPGQSLRSKFIRLGKLKGRTKNEILAVVGIPTATSSLPSGKTLLQWQATGYHICLIFDGDLCEGVTHEFASR